MPDLDKEEMRKAIESAINKWMDKQFAAFGKWSLITFAGLVFASLVYFVLKMNGWHQ